MQPPDASSIPPSPQPRATYQPAKLEVYKQWKSIVGIGLSIGPFSVPIIPIDSEMDFSLMPVQGDEL